MGLWTCPWKASEIGSYLAGANLPTGSTMLSVYQDRRHRQWGGFR